MEMELQKKLAGSRSVIRTGTLSDRESLMGVARNRCPVRMLFTILLFYYHSSKQHEVLKQTETKFHI